MSPDDVMHIYSISSLVLVPGTVPTLVRSAKIFLKRGGPSCGCQNISRIWDIRSSNRRTLQYCSTRRKQDEIQYAILSKGNLIFSNRCVQEGRGHLTRRTGTINQWKNEWVNKSINLFACTSFSRKSTFHLVSRASPLLSPSTVVLQYP